MLLQYFHSAKTTNHLLIDVSKILTHRAAWGWISTATQLPYPAHKHQDMRDEDYWREKKRSAMILSNQLIALKLPHFIWIFLYPLKSVTRNETKVLPTQIPILTWLTVLFQRLGLITCFPVRVYPRLEPLTSFSPALRRFHVSRAWHGLVFPAHGKGRVFSHAWHWLRVFPHLALVTCFPRLGTGYVFSRACDWLRVFPRLALVTFWYEGK